MPPPVARATTSATTPITRDKLRAAPAGAHRPCGLAVAELGRRALGRHDVQVEAGAELEPREMGEARHDVDPPAERVGPLWGGADPQVERWVGAEPATEAGEPLGGGAGARGARGL